ncbi:hypothetical protein DFH08DRAFT_825969 [Mycena albidolilacea]|uniref:Uncharacterized protein n=1 Tax=Mycena albidolilacea TaxID=1033008 RepID=A0AAD6Z1C0_9AGAR|nr:hypothetical protein DFH08DRAFT_825969 [Mycena albidolilacea]
MSIHHFVSSSNVHIWRIDLIDAPSKPALDDLRLAADSTRHSSSITRYLVYVPSNPNLKYLNHYQVTISPVWRIKGLDPHQDTPVEILHVVLLGFVKYLWRDLVQLQLNKKDEKKELLATRLSSLDVSGLGRDCRAILQVAPFVIYDLVSDDCFKTWQALSKIVPLIWQPEIDDIESHIHGRQAVGSTRGWSAASRPPNLFCEIISHLFANGHDFMRD